MMKKIKQDVTLRTIIILWVIGVVISLVLTRDFKGAYDSADYWNRGCSLWNSDKFSLLNMQDGFRGYMYPFYLGICYRIGRGWNGFLIINSLSNALFMALIMPRLHGIDYHNSIKCIVCYIVFGFFFIGLLLYSLSDLFAIILCSLGIVLEMELRKSHILKKNSILGLFLGAVLYMAYNVRTIYLFADAAIIIKLILYFYKQRQEIFQNVVSGICVAMGVGIAAIPQVYMNYHMLGIISMKVPTGGLMLQQVFWGLQYQRYDTYVVRTPNHMSPSMYFIDPVGNRLLSELGIEGFSDWGEFVKLLLDYPIEIFGIYVRHFVNMLFPCWPNQYVMDLSNCKIISAVPSLLMFFIFGLGVLNKLFSGKVFENYIALLIPILFITPGAVEIRFYAALYIMVIGALCYNLDWKKLYKHVLDRKIKVGVCFVIYSSLMLTIWSGMLASDSCCGIYF